MMSELSIQEYEELFCFYQARQWGASIKDWYEARSLCVQVGERDITKLQIMKSHEPPKPQVGIVSSIKSYLQGTGHLRSGEHK
jgi:hypothetical protein